MTCRAKMFEIALPSFDSKQKGLPLKLGVKKGLKSFEYIF